MEDRVRPFAELFNPRREEIFFHHSLVIAVCSGSRHRSLGADGLLDYKVVPLGLEKLSQSNSSILDTEDTVQAPAPPSPTPNQTLDISTVTALIGRDNLDVSLGDLGLQHETVDEILNIYAVVRQLGTEKRNEEDSEEEIEVAIDIGKNVIFRFDEKWVSMS